MRPANLHRLTEHVQTNRLVRWGVRIVSEQGRPLASVILLWSSLMLLLSDWPAWWPSLPQPVASITQSLSGSFGSGRHFMFDRYQRESPRLQQSQPVTIVAIDEKSLAKLGQWPWPRHQLAALIDTIGRHQPAAVGLDMYMPEVDQTSPDQVARSLQPRHPDLARQLRTLPTNDELLASSLGQTPTVLGAAGFDFKTFTTSEGLRTWPLDLQGADALPPAARDYPAVLASLPLLQSAAAGQALLSVDVADGAVRRMPLVASVAGQPVPSLAIEMFRVATGSPQTRVQIEPHGVAAVEVADLQVPTQAGGEVYVHFARQSSTLARYVSAVDVMHGKVDPQALQGKLVLLGLTGFGLNDMRTTALGEHVPGIEIQAQLIESLFDQRFLLRPWWMIFAEIGSALLVGTLMIWLIPRLKPERRLGLVYQVPKAGLLASLGINAAVVSVGFYLFRQHGLLFDAASFFLVTSAVFGMIFAFAQASASRQKQAQKEQAWIDLQQRLAQAEAEIASRAAALSQPGQTP